MAKYYWKLLEDYRNFGKKNVKKLSKQLTWKSWKKIKYDKKMPWNRIYWPKINEHYWKFGKGKWVMKVWKSLKIGENWVKKLPKKHKTYWKWINRKSRKKKYTEINHRLLIIINYCRKLGKKLAEIRK